jgi:hypothetical protein
LGALHNPVLGLHFDPRAGLFCNQQTGEGFDPRTGRRVLFLPPRHNHFNQNPNRLY